MIDHRLCRGLRSTSVIVGQVECRLFVEKLLWLVRVLWTESGHDAQRTAMTAQVGSEDPQALRL